MAPEILLSQEYNNSVDIWSAGVVMYILISGKHPLFEKSNHQYDDYVQVLKDKPVISYPEELGFTKLSADLLSRMLDYRETSRFNADQCL